MEKRNQKKQFVVTQVNRSKLFLLAFLVALISAGCSDVREKTAEELLENTKMQEEIFTAIIADPSLLSGFIEKMESDGSAKKALMNNAPIMRMMFMSDKIDSLMDIDMEVHKAFMNRMMMRMETDSTACAMMCGKMSEQNCITMIEKMRKGKSKK